jgi:hypothetical protein
LPAEAYPEFSVFLAVRELLLDHDSQFRSPNGANDCVDKEYKTARQYDGRDRAARTLRVKLSASKARFVGTPCGRLRVVMETHSYESRASEIVHEGITTEVEQMATFASGARFEAWGSIHDSNSVRILDAWVVGLGHSMVGL